MAEQQHKAHVTVLNILGFAGYLLAALQWLLVVAIGLPAVIDSPFGDFVMPEGPRRPMPEVTAPVPHGPSSAVSIVVLTAMAMAVVLGVMYVVIVYYTSAVTRVTSEVAHAVTKRAVPVIARKPVEKIAPQKRTLLTRRILFWLKFTLAIMPVALLYITWYPHHTDMVGELIMLLCAMLSILALVCFFAQAVLAKRWHVRSSEVR